MAEKPLFPPNTTNSKGRRAERRAANTTTVVNTNAASAAPAAQPQKPKPSGAKQPGTKDPELLADQRAAAKQTKAAAPAKGSARGKQPSAPALSDAEKAVDQQRAPNSSVLSKKQMAASAKAKQAKDRFLRNYYAQFKLMENIQALDYELDPTDVTLTNSKIMWPFRTPDCRDASCLIQKGQVTYLDRPTIITMCIAALKVLKKKRNELLGDNAQTNALAEAKRLSALATTAFTSAFDDRRVLLAHSENPQRFVFGSPTHAGKSAFLYKNAWGKLDTCEIPSGMTLCKAHFQNDGSIVYTGSHHTSVQAPDSRQATHNVSRQFKGVQSRISRKQAEDDKHDLAVYLRRLSKHSGGRITLEDYYHDKSLYFEANPHDANMLAVAPRAFRDAYQYWLANHDKPTFVTRRVPHKQNKEPKHEFVRRYFTAFQKESRAPAQSAPRDQDDLVPTYNRAEEGWAVVHRRPMSLIPYLAVRFPRAHNTVWAVAEEGAKHILEAHFAFFRIFVMLYSVIESVVYGDSANTAILRLICHLAYIVDPLIALGLHFVWNLFSTNAPMSLLASTDDAGAAPPAKASPPPLSAAAARAVQHVTKPKSAARTAGSEERRKNAEVRDAHARAYGGALNNVNRNSRDIINEVDRASIEEAIRAHKEVEEEAAAEAARLKKSKEDEATAISRAHIIAVGKLVWGKDYDKRHTFDPETHAYVEGKGVPYILDCLSEQGPFVDYDRVNLREDPLDNQLACVRSLQSQSDLPIPGHLGKFLHIEILSHKKCNNVQSSDQRTDQNSYLRAPHVVVVECSVRTGVCGNFFQDPFGWLFGCVEQPKILRLSNATYTVNIAQHMDISKSASCATLEEEINTAAALSAGSRANFRSHDKSCIETVVFTALYRFCLKGEVHGTNLETSMVMKYLRTVLYSTILTLLCVCLFLLTSNTP